MNHNKTIWLFVGAFFIIGDLVTTYYGLTYLLITEGNPLAASLYSSYGFGSLVLTKAIFTGIMFSIWRRMNHQSRIGIPIGLAVIGGFATVWNSFHIGIILYV